MSAIHRLAIAALSTLTLAACDAGTATDGDTVADATPDATTAADSDPGSDGSADVATVADADTVADTDIDIDAPADTVADTDGGPLDDADTTEVTGVRVRWDWAAAEVATPDTLDFFAFPWPEGRRYDADGTLRLAGFPNPAAATTCAPPTADLAIGLLLHAIAVEDYRDYVVTAADHDLTAFGLSTPVYFAFDGPLSDTLPSPAETLTADAPALLVNVDRASARFGERVPLRVQVADDSRYLPPHTLVLAPVPGFTMAAGSRYAAVVRRGLGDATGAPLETPEAFEQLKSDAATTPDALRYADAFDALEDLGVFRADVAAMSVFDTGDPVAPLAAVASAVEAVATPGPLLNVQIDGVEERADLGFTVVEGTIDTLLYQRGAAPCFPHIAPTIEVTEDSLPQLILPESWSVTFDPDDACGALLDGPAPNAPGPGPDDAPRTEPIPFRLTLPTSALTPGGTVDDLPLVLYGHGTGGSATSPLGADREAPVLAQLGVAVFSITGVMHDERAHVDALDPALVEPVTALGALLDQDLVGALADAVASGDLFFNPLNLYAARGNLQQSAVDFIWLAHALPKVSWSIPMVGGSATVHFDPARVAFFGHSQGGLTGPLAALSAHLDALMLSAPGGHLPSSLVTKTKPASPFPTSEFTAFLLCDPGHVTPSHPLLAVLGAFFDPGDAVNYMRHVAWEPLAGPKHVFVTEGVDDHYAPPAVNEAITTAGHLAQVAPALRPVEGQALLDALEGGGFGLMNGDISGNVARAGAPWTAGFRQYGGVEGCKDDHFVYRCVPEAKADWTEFFATWLSDDAPTIPAGAP